MKTNNNWIKASIAKPATNRDVLVYFSNCYYLVASWDDNKWHGSNGMEVKEVSHWMDLTVPEN